MAKVNGNKGITMVALAVTIIVLMIISGITIYAGTDILKTIKIEEVQTNLISIKSKAKGIAEEINAIVWAEQDKATKRAQQFEEKYNMKLVEVPKVSLDSSIIDKGNFECYLLQEETFNKLGLSGILKDENDVKYYVIYDTNSMEMKDDETTIELDVIRDPGVSYEEKDYYNLEKIQKVLNDNQ